ncbi:MAG: FumA C-terminus/TtdB family hydratase beta subunit [Planctomycetota bacterium]|nr:FumA C-terminus/TtdB family hydratase beta subunit [Planctomycetota bacterium]
MSAIELTTPIPNEQIAKLKAGDPVLLNGTMVTARDAGHKYLIENFVEQHNEAEQETFDKLRGYLENGIIYHCGPVVKKEENGSYRFISAGPTTSIREEVYESEVMALFDIAGVIGKGGMGGKTLKGCMESTCVYFHAIGGAGALIAKSVKRVVDVLKIEFGTPEAFWVIEVENFPCLVTMDSHGNSVHDRVAEESGRKFKEMLDR